MIDLSPAVLSAWRLLFVRLPRRGHYTPRELEAVLAYAARGDANLADSIRTILVGAELLVETVQGDDVYESEWKPRTEDQREGSRVFAECSDGSASRWRSAVTREAIRRFNEQRLEAMPYDSWIELERECAAELRQGGDE